MGYTYAAVSKVIQYSLQQILVLQKPLFHHVFFESMKPVDKPMLTKASKLVGASGSPINEKGKARFSLQLGAVKLQVEAIVADIEDDGLLGVDVLQNGKEGPTDILLCKGVLMIENQEVPIIQVGIKQCIRRVTAADHSIIPAQSEAVIDVSVERRNYDDYKCESEYIIEPTEHFRQECPLQMASTLVDINQGCTCRVRMLNPFPTAISIKQNSVLGTAEPIIGTPNAVVQHEDELERTNYCRVRRLQLQQKFESSLVNDDIKPNRRVENRDLMSVPEHLISLYEKSSEGLTSEEKDRLQQLFINADTLRSQIQHAHEVAKEHLNVAAKRSKAIYDTKISVKRYKVGDLIWCLDESRKVGITPKLEQI